MNGLPWGFKTDIRGKTLVGVRHVKNEPDNWRYSSSVDIVLDFADGTRTSYYASGDCCSTSWVEHVTVPDLGSGATVLDLKDSGGLDATEEQEAQTKEAYVARGDKYGPECLRVYHTSIVTDKGEVIIEYRNDSNGYYGGSLEETNRWD